METNHAYEYKWYTRIMQRYRFSSLPIPFFNVLSRSFVRLLFLYDKFRVERFCGKRHEEIEQWRTSTRFFFGFALSRSGTSYLGNILKREAGNALVEHEPNIADLLHFPEALLSEELARQYIASYRINEMYFRTHRSQKKVYGEISPHLRQHCGALRELLPHALFFHIVRDGRDVVSSLFARGRLGKRDPILYHLSIPADDPYAEQWPDMTRFQRICWLWQRDNRYLRETIGYTVHFEKMVKDYQYFKEKILDYLDLEIDADTWNTYTAKPTNPTPGNKLTKWQHWSKEQIADFERICGKEMEQNGYTL